MPQLVLVGGTIYPSPLEEPVRGGTVVIDGAKIAAAGRIEVPPGVPTLDCRGCSITAGFWNSHVHFFERKWASAVEIPAVELARQLEQTFTRYGFTTVFDLSSLWENTRAIRDRIESGGATGPRIFSTGPGLIPPGALPPDSVLGIMGLMKTPMPEVADAEQATAAVRKLLADGVDAIKLFASGSSKTTLSEEAMRAAADEAHRAGKQVFVHPNSAEDLVRSVASGVDIVAHTTPRSGPWDEVVLRAMTDRNVALTPTLTLHQHFLRHDRISAQEQVVGVAVEQLRVWAASGGTVLFGTDLGAVDPDPREEYRLMAEAGLSFEEILASLTTAPAERFGQAGQSRVAAGLPADLVVLDGDPSKNLVALTQVLYTLRGGTIIHRASGSHRAAI